MDWFLFSDEPHSLIPEKVLNILQKNFPDCDFWIDNEYFVGKVQNPPKVLFARSRGSSYDCVHSFALGAFFAFREIG